MNEVPVVADHVLLHQDTTPAMALPPSALRLPFSLHLGFMMMVP